MADGLFAEYGLDVELVESPPGSQRVKLLATGGGDFLLTATLYHLEALAEEAQLPVRACAVLHRRSPVAGLLPSNSTALEPGDLAGLRLGAPMTSQMGWLAVELQAALAEGGVAPAEIVEMTYRDAYGAIARGEIDLIANFSDLLPIDERRAGVPLRAVEVGRDVYTSSLLAAASLDDGVVDRMVSAMAASFERQREDPERGVDELRARYPSVDRDVAVETWRRLEPYVFTEAGMGGMDDAGWELTISWARRVHGLPRTLSVDDVVRPRV